MSKLGVLYVIYITGHFGGGLTTSSTDAELVGAVAIVLFFLYGIFVVIQMILCFVAFAQMKNKEIESNKQ